MRARVIVIAGPSGSGKSRLSRRLALPVLNLDDFYKDGSDPTLPRIAMGHDSIVDWDDPDSWSRAEAVDAITRLCEHGTAEVPIYDIAHDGRTGAHRLDLGGSRFFLTEGIFAQEVVQECRARGLLADAICVSNHRLVTFWRRLTRDLRERRKHPFVLVRRGMMLLRSEPAVIAHAVALGCTAMTTDQAYEHVRRLVAAGTNEDDSGICSRTPPASARLAARQIPHPQERPMTTRLNPYISFRDTAREAMDFYQSVFGGELTRMTFAELQASEDPAEQEKIMHSLLVTDNGLVLMAADTPNSMDYQPGGPIAVSLSGEDEAELRGYWEKLSDGGAVTAPFERAPWGDTFGMCVDKFGVSWMVNAAAPA